MPARCSAPTRVTLALLGLLRSSRCCAARRRGGRSPGSRAGADGGPAPRGRAQRRPATERRCAPRFNPLIALPPLVFLGFALLLLVALKRENRDELPSALAGRQAPSLAAAAALRADPPPTDADLRAGEVTLVNVWASWCGPCRVEHPVLTELAAAGTKVIGINYKDPPEQALGFLAELGDPYAAIAADSAGRIGLDWGIYGVPETFVVDGDGTILLRHPGPLTADIVAARIAPLLERTQ